MYAGMFCASIAQVFSISRAHYKHGGFSKEVYDEHENNMFDDGCFVAAW